MATKKSPRGEQANLSPTAGTSSSAELAVRRQDETALATPNARRLFPDLASSGIRFMRFFLHAEGGWQWVDEFWRKKGFPRTGGVGLAFAPYTRGRKRHTVSIQWRKSGESCADLRISVDSESPAALGYNKRSEVGHLDAGTFAEFLSRARTHEVVKISPQYGVLVPAHAMKLPLPPEVEITSFSARVGKGERKYRLDFERVPEGWLLVAEPPSNLALTFDATDEKFFALPLRHAQTLAEAVGGQSGRS